MSTSCLLLGHLLFLLGFTPMVGLALLPEEDHIQATSGSESGDLFVNLFFKYACVISVKETTKESGQKISYWITINLSYI